MDECPKGKPSTSEEYQWGRQQILSLINNVEEFFEDFYDGTKKKKAIWQSVALKMQKEGYNFTGVECDKKWRNLKATYIKVLQKQIHGDSSYRFEYFDALHHILGKEIDPLGMRDQVLIILVIKKASGSKLPQSSHLLPLNENYGGNSEYQEITVDEGFVWVHSAVNLLLDQVKETLSNISSPATIQERWQEISEQMTNEGHHVSNLQCQRKWENMQDGYYYQQTKSQATGLVPRWPYFNSIKDIMVTLNIPVTVQVDLKNNMRLGEKGLKIQGPRTIFSRKRHLDGEYQRVPSRSILNRLQQLESNTSINRRLDYLEEQVEDAQIQREAYTQTNNILTQIISELRKINQMVETENDYRYGNHQQQHHIARSGSPNQGIIIVEDISGQL